MSKWTVKRRGLFRRRWHIYDTYGCEQGFYLTFPEAIRAAQEQARRPLEDTYALAKGD